MAATRPSQCGASRHTFVPGAKYLEPRTGFFVSPPRSRRRHAPSGTRSSWECGELSKRLRKRAIEVPYALTTRHLRHLCIKEPVAHPGAACSEKEVTRIEEAETSKGVHDLIRRLGSLNSGAEPRRKYTATSYRRISSPRRAAYSQDCPVHVQASCSAPHPWDGTSDAFGLSRCTVSTDPPTSK